MIQRSASPFGSNIFPSIIRFPSSTTSVFTPLIFEAFVILTVCPHILPKYNTSSLYIASHLELEFPVSNFEADHVAVLSSEDVNTKFVFVLAGIFLITE